MKTAQQNLTALIVAADKARTFAEWAMEGNLPGAASLYLELDAAIDNATGANDPENYPPDDVTASKYGNSAEYTAAKRDIERRTLHPVMVQALSPLFGGM